VLFALLCCAAPAGGQSPYVGRFAPEELQAASIGQYIGAPQAFRKGERPPAAAPQWSEAKRRVSGEDSQVSGCERRRL